MKYIYASVGIILAFVWCILLLNWQRDGKLYDVPYDGNITIYEKRPFTTCEER